MSARREMKVRRGRPMPVLGVDVGGVLVDRVAEDSDASFFGAVRWRLPRSVGRSTLWRASAPGPLSTGYIWCPRLDRRSPR